MDNMRCIGCKGNISIIRSLYGKSVMSIEPLKWDSHSEGALIGLLPISIFIRDGIIEL